MLLEEVVRSTFRSSILNTLVKRQLLAVSSHLREKGFTHPPTGGGGGRASPWCGGWGSERRRGQPDAQQLEDGAELGLPRNRASYGSSTRICGHAPKKHGTCGLPLCPDDGHSDNTKPGKEKPRELSMWAFTPIGSTLVSLCCFRFFSHAFSFSSFWIFFGSFPPSLPDLCKVSSSIS